MMIISFPLLHSVIHPPNGSSHYSPLCHWNKVEDENENEMMKKNFDFVFVYERRKTNMKSFSHEFFSIFFYFTSLLI